MRTLILLCAAFLLTGNAVAGEIKVTGAWTKGTLASQRNSSAYMEITSDEAGVIIGASSPLAQSVEMRDMHFEFDGGPMRPGKIEQIPFEARKKLQLTPVTAHFALIGLSQPVNAGDRIPLTLKLRMKSGEERTVQVEAPGRAMSR